MDKIAFTILSITKEVNKIITKVTVFSAKLAILEIRSCKLFGILIHFFQFYMTTL